MSSAQWGPNSKFREEDLLFIRSISNLESLDLGPGWFLKKISMNRIIPIQAPVISTFHGKFQFLTFKGGSTRIWPEKCLDSAICSCAPSCLYHGSPLTLPLLTIYPVFPSCNIHSLLLGPKVLYKNCFPPQFESIVQVFQWNEIRRPLTVTQKAVH